MKPKTFFCALLTALLVAPPVSRAADDEAQIRKLEHDWINAIKNKDGAYLSKLEVDDYTFTGPDGVVLDKTGDIETVTGSDTVYNELKIDSLKVRVYGDSAVVNGVGTLKGRYKDEDMSGQYSWTDVFVKRDGEWKAVAAHVTAMANKGD
jgi:ketosteroid isomerase-like protein